MIDLCKIFGVEEGEEFKIRYKDGDITRKYAIKDNRLIVVRDKLLGKAIVVLEVNQLNDISDIIKLPKKKQFTDDELCILRNVDKEYEWIARDKDDNYVFLYEFKPIKGSNSWNDGGITATLDGFSNLFQSIQWEDEEPVCIDDYVER